MVTPTGFACDGNGASSHHGRLSPYGSNASASADSPRYVYGCSWGATTSLLRIKHSPPCEAQDATLPTAAKLRSNAGTRIANDNSQSQSGMPKTSDQPTGSSLKGSSPRSKI